MDKHLRVCERKSGSNHEHALTQKGKAWPDSVRASEVLHFCLMSRCYPQHPKYVTGSKLEVIVSYPLWYAIRTSKVSHTYRIPA